MEHKHTSFDKALIAVVIIYELIILIVAALFLFTNTFGGFKSSLGMIEHMGINEMVTYGLFLSGAMGGAFYALRGMYQRIGDAYTPIDNSDPKPAKTLNIKSWAFWFLYRPIQGGMLALVLLALLKSNLLVVDELSPEKIKSFYFLIGLGFLAGFGSHEVIHKIEELVKVLFAKAKLKSTNSEDKVKENSGEK
jgi:hypothetical protein